MCVCAVAAWRRVCSPPSLCLFPLSLDFLHLFPILSSALIRCSSRTPTLQRRTAREYRMQLWTPNACLKKREGSRLTLQNRYSLVSYPVPPTSCGLSLLYRLLATLGPKNQARKISRKELIAFNLEKACEYISQPPEPLALRTSATLLYGVAK